MNFLNKILILFFIFLISACVNNTSTRSKHKPDKIFYSSSGFALLYDESYYDEKIIKSKLDNNTISIFHSLKIKWKNRYQLELGAFNDGNYNAWGTQEPARNNLPFFVAQACPA